jgi:hypothetical protein
VLCPSSTTQIVAGCYLKAPPTTSFAAINLAANVIVHPLPNCRLYYSEVTVEPQKSIDYVQRNRKKKVIYRSFVTNSYNDISVGSSFNDLVNSGIVHPTAVLICPFIGAVANSGFGDFQWKSPFDTCPATSAPLSLINLQVAVGGKNFLQSTLHMTYENENFLQQTTLAEQSTSSDFGVSTGLINRGYWEASKWYFVNVERGNIADKLQPRNINVSFTNNSRVIKSLHDHLLLKKEKGGPKSAQLRQLILRDGRVYVTSETNAAETPALTTQEQGKRFDLPVSRGKDLRDTNLRRTIELCMPGFHTMQNLLAFCAAAQGPLPLFRGGDAKELQRESVCCLLVLNSVTSTPAEVA